MAANYWTSTQYLYWRFSKKDLEDSRLALEGEDQALVQQYPLPDRRHLSIFFNLREHAGLVAGKSSLMMFYRVK